MAAKHNAVLLANHGPVVAGTSLEAAMNAAEELEETAQLYLLAARPADAVPDVPSRSRRSPSNIHSLIPRNPKPCRALPPISA